VAVDPYRRLLAVLEDDPIDDLPADDRAMAASTVAAHSDPSAGSEAAAICRCEGSIAVISRTSSTSWPHCA